MVAEKEVMKTMWESKKKLNWKWGLIFHMTLFIGQNVSTFGGNLENYGTPIKINTLKYKHNNGFI